jgi:hypothetical protein
MQDPPATPNELLELLATSFFDGNASSPTPLPADAATLTEQQVQTALLDDIKAAQTASVNLTSQVYIDDDDVYCIQTISIDGGVPTLHYFDTNGDPYTPIPPLTPLSSPYTATQVEFLATTNGTGYSNGDTLLQIVVLDTSIPGFSPVSFWYNLNTASVIAAPPSTDYISDILLDTQLLTLTQQLADTTGTITDAAETNPANNATQIALLKGILSKMIGLIAIDAIQNTYGAAVTNLVSPGSATDIFELRNPAGSGKVIYIKHLSLSGTATNQTNANLLLIKRTTLNTGGTSTAPTVGKYDSANPAAAGVVLAYTANPSALGAGVALHSEKVYLGTTNVNAVNSDLWEEATTSNNAQDITLHPGEALCINLNATTIAGGVFNIDAVWTEV